MDVTFCNIYASNANRTAFLSKVYNHLFRFEHPFLVIGGDFNLPFSPVADRTLVADRPPPSRLSHHLQRFL